jgi:NIMA (never in mitosis gene a)-related kinase
LPYNEKSDIWSLGCVLFEMAALKPPFRANDMEGLYKKVVKGIFPPIPSQYSKDLEQVTNYLLQKSPKIRPSAKEIIEFDIVQSHKESKTKLNERTEISLLDTIKLPKNLRGLGSVLPKSNYEEKETTEK